MAGGGGGGGAGYVGAIVGTVGSILSTIGEYRNRPKKWPTPQWTDGEREMARDIRGYAQEGRDTMEGASGQFAQLAPSLYDLAGYDVQTMDLTPQRNQAELAYQQNMAQLYQAQQAYDMAKQAGNRMQGKMHPMEAERYQRQLETMQNDVERLSTNQRTLAQAVGYYRANPVKVMGIRRKADAAARDQARGAIYDAYNQKLSAALKGDVPDNPALVRQINDQERVLREGLARQLGPNFEQTTAGQTALATFNQRKLETLDQARRADISQYGERANQAARTMADVSGAEQRMASFVPSWQQDNSMAMYQMASQIPGMMKPLTDQRLLKAGIQQRNLAVPSNATTHFLVAGKGWKDAGAAWGAAGLAQDSSNPAYNSTNASAQSYSSMIASQPDSSFGGGGGYTGASGYTGYSY